MNVFRRIRFPDVVETLQRGEFKPERQLAALARRLRLLSKFAQSKAKEPTMILFRRTRLADVFEVLQRGEFSRAWRLARSWWRSA